MLLSLTLNELYKIARQKVIMASNLNTIIQWFAQFSDRYVESYLSPSYVSVDRLRSDPEYGLKLFIMALEI